jgi:hypothetical protein
VHLGDQGGVRRGEVHRPVVVAAVGDAAVPAGITVEVEGADQPRVKKQHRDRPSDGANSDRRAEQERVVAEVDVVVGELDEVDPEVLVEAGRTAASWDGGTAVRDRGAGAAGATTTGGRVVARFVGDGRP